MEKNVLTVIIGDYNNITTTLSVLVTLIQVHLKVLLELEKQV